MAPSHLCYKTRLSLWLISKQHHKWHQVSPESQRDSLGSFMPQQGDTLADAVSLIGDSEATETAFCGFDEAGIVKGGGACQGSSFILPALLSYNLTQAEEVGVGPPGASCEIKLI